MLNAESWLAGTPPNRDFFVLVYGGWRQFLNHQGALSFRINYLPAAESMLSIVGMSPPYDIQDRTYEFSVQIVSFCRYAMRLDTVMRLLATQLLKAATSVGSNMEEADGGQTKADFIAKVSIAKKEAKEAVYWLRLIEASEPPLRQRLSPLLDEAKQIAAIVSRIQMNAEAGRNRGGTATLIISLAAGWYWLSSF